MRARTRSLWVSALVLSSVLAGSQDLPRARGASVTLEPPETISIERGRPGTVGLQFRVARGFHINSNRPRQEYLKKTELRLDPPQELAIAKIDYPEGQDQSFPFAADEKLNVYTGDFSIAVVVRPLKTVSPAKYPVHGVLKYQACDNAACYPPKELAVAFEVNVTKAQSGMTKPGAGN